MSRQMELMPREPWLTPPTDPLGVLGTMPVMLSMSGGKDSTAMALYLREHDIAFDAMFLDTGWEHPETYRYLDEVLEPLFGPIARVSAVDKAGNKVGMVETIRKKAMFPARTKRWCTQELKVFPAIKHINERYEGLVINAVGIRAAESRARADMAEWEHFPPIGAAAVWRPLIAWTEGDVIAMHQRHNVAPNPLYLAGASRVGCWPCIYARKGEIRFLAETDPARVEQIAALEDEITAAANARAAAKGEANVNPRTFFPDRGQASDSGAMMIHDIVAWAKDRNPARGELDVLGMADEGCMRWGMCDTPEAEETGDGTAS